MHRDVGMIRFPANYRPQAEPRKINWPIGEGRFAVTLTAVFGRRF
jgi:hypothetical protein